MQPVLFEREKRFSAAMALAKSLLMRGLITLKEYGEIRSILVEKHRSLIGGL